MQVTTAHPVIIGSLLASLAMPVMASDFTVSPVRIFMSPADRAVAVTITNGSAQPLMMQADLYHWSQDADGEEVLEITEDLFLSPPIIRLEGGGRQVVRLARMTTASPPEQLTYRLIIREIPEATTPAEGVEVQVALALSLPVFITPARAQAELDCAMEAAPDNRMSVACTNTGTAYAQPRELSVTDGAGQVLAQIETALYILPGTTRSYSLDMADTLPTGQARLVVVLDDNTQKVFSTPTHP